MKPWLMYGLLRCYQHLLKGRIQKAWGMVSLRKIKNKGEGCNIHGQITIFYPEKCKIGNNVRIGEGAFLFCKGGLEINDNTQISRNVCVYTANHNIAGNQIPYDQTYIEKKVIIGHSVWIGMNVCIVPGTIIGDGAIIGMGTTVSGEVPEGAIIVGAYSRQVGNRDMTKFNMKRNLGAYYNVI